MRGVVKVRRWWPVVVAVWVLNGCGDECAQAVSLCEDCDPKPETCEALFKDKSTEFCAAAVADYEAGCTE